MTDNLDSSVPFLRRQDADAGFEAAGPSMAARRAAPRSAGISPDSAKMSRLKHLQEIGFISPEQRQQTLEGTGLEAVIGDVNNLLPAWFLEVGAANSRAVCLIQASGTNYRGQRGAWSGTGFLIAPNILLTNHHVINSMRVGQNATCVFDYQVNVDGSDRQTRSCVCNNEWRLVALHHASKASGNRGILNEGIKVSAIAAHLERLIESGQNVAQARTVLSLFRGSDEALGYFGTLGRQVDGRDDLEIVTNSYQGEADDIDVAFWNVEWFANRFNDKVDDAARIIFDANVDVWALEESSPAATKRLIDVLNEDFDLSYKMLACEPNASSNSQTCTVIWNTKTIDVELADWGDPIEDWLQTHSRDFDDLGLEAVEGKIFNRYPGLFMCRARNRPDDAAFDFYLVPLHLKAMSEGSKRRKMASKILAASVARKIEEGADKDWIIGGDYNAQLATGDFDALIEGGLTAASAADEQDGAITYLKGRYKSLIDHIFLSPNLASQYGTDDFFILAADHPDHPDPRDFIRNISDHRPVLMRLSLAGRVEELRPTAPKAVLTSKSQKAKSKKRQS